MQPPFPLPPPTYIKGVPVQARSPNQELGERGRVERQVEVVDRGVFQVEAGGGCCPIDDGLVLALLPGAAHCGIGCIG